MLRLFSLALLAVLAASASAQPVTDSERVQGYALRGDTLLFAFDAAQYGVEPERVVVTGAFRGWSDGMDDTAWALAEGPGEVWTLAVPNDAYGVVGAGTPFKFRIDTGRWLDPPVDAPNAEDGNLVFLHGMTPPRLVAELRGPEMIWVEVTGAERPLDPRAYDVERWDGEPSEVGVVLPQGATTALLVLRHPIDTARVHYVHINDSGPSGQSPRSLRAAVRFDGLWRSLYTGKPLGGHPHNCCGLPYPEGSPDCVVGCAAGTTFRLFAPRADSVHLYLYQDRTSPASAEHAMLREPEGTWSYRDDRDLYGTWYDYAVYGPDGPGSHFTNQTGKTVSDPYALVSDDSWGRVRVWGDGFVPPQPVRGGRPAMEDVVAYEVHLQDFTDDLPMPEGVGPLEAFATPGLTNSRGEPVGLDYLERLGINAVHLMPVQEFLHYPDDAWQDAFAGDPFMQAQGVADENYQWGYRTTHAFAIESRFRSAGDEPGRERERFRDLVDALHQRGLAVLIDVVFNHTGENMEGAQQLLTFNGIDKWYYYRLNDEGEHIGAFGNEVKSENRPMTQRWLLDQLRHFVEVFGVDGFRIDLAGQTDEQTLRWIQAELGDDVLIYGEPWIGSNDPDYEANPDWDWYKADSPITFFQDDARNAFKGSPGQDPTPAPASRGFAGGDPEAREPAMRGIANDYPEEPTPTAGINYLDIHDNWALADRFASCQTGDCAWDGRAGVREAEMRIAAALLLTSLGPVVIHGGTEIARSKGIAPLPDEIDGEWERTEMALAPIYIKGRGDTYNLRAANRFLWETVGQSEGPVDVAGLEDWWRGLIDLRLSEDGAVFRVGEPVPDGWVRFLTPDDPHALGYLVGDRVLVLVNTGEDQVTFDLQGAPGLWRPVATSGADDAHIDMGGIGRPFMFDGPVEMRLSPKEVSIWVQE